jgi:hypothetical protein
MPTSTTRRRSTGTGSGGVRSATDARLARHRGPDARVRGWVQAWVQVG